MNEQKPTPPRIIKRRSPAAVALSAPMIATAQTTTPGFQLHSSSATSSRVQTPRISPKKVNDMASGKLKIEVLSCQVVPQVLRPCRCEQRVL
jgi:hypothetical protein